MSILSPVAPPEVAAVFNGYPSHAAEKLQTIRLLIFTVAKEENLGFIEETLKWGEPSYISAMGSTLRIAWKDREPSQYSLYFNCNTKLIDTFKELYPDALRYKGNREITINMQETVPVAVLRPIIATTLQYHRVKHLPLLGMQPLQT